MGGQRLNLYVALSELRLELDKYKQITYTTKYHYLGFRLGYPIYTKQCFCPLFRSKDFDLACL